MAKYVLRAIFGVIVFLFLGIDTIVEGEFRFWPYPPYIFDSRAEAIVFGSFFILFGAAWFWSEIWRGKREKKKRAVLQNSTTKEDQGPIVTKNASKSS
jgi:hypothetical protein